MVPVAQGCSKCSSCTTELDVKTLGDGAGDYSRGLRDCCKDSPDSKLPMKVKKINSKDANPCEYSKSSG